MTTTPTRSTPQTTSTPPLGVRPLTCAERGQAPAPPRPLTIALAEDCEVVSQGLARMLLPHAARVRVVPARADAVENGVSIGTAGPPAQLTLLDCFPAPAVDGAVRGRLTTLAPAHDVVVWTWDMSPELVDAALRRGFRGYLSKALPADGLVDALERIHAGELVVAPAGHRLDREPVAVHWPGHDAQLTPREADVVSLVTNGASNQEIAEHLYLSINSVKSYIRSAYRKMGVASRAQAMLWGIEHGFLSPSDDDGETSLTHSEVDGDG